MGFLSKFFNRKKQQPEDDFKITITDHLIRVEHPKRKTEEVKWDNIQEIKMINTDSGPWIPDVWLALISEVGGV